MKFLFVYVVFICNFGQLIYLFNLKFNKMKKVLVILAAAGLLIAMSSCTKKCTCKTYADGEVIMEDEVLVGGNTGYKNCADPELNNAEPIDGKLWGLKCE